MTHHTLAVTLSLLVLTLLLLAVLRVGRLVCGAVWEAKRKLDEDGWSCVRDEELN